MSVTRLTYWFKPVSKMGGVNLCNSAASADTANATLQCSTNSYVNIQSDSLRCSSSSNNTKIVSSDILPRSSVSNEKIFNDKLHYSSHNDKNMKLSVNGEVKATDLEKRDECVWKDIKIPGIYTLEELENVCVNFKLKMNCNPCHLDELRKIRKGEENQSFDEEEYEVEKITKFRVIHGVIEYRVKWKGWNSSFNTWENLSNLKNCRAVVDEFHTLRNIDQFGNKRKRETVESVKKIKKAKIESLISDLANRQDFGSLLKLKGGPTSIISMNRYKSTNKLVKELRQILKTVPLKKGFLEQLISSKNGQLDEFMSFVEKRRETLIKLKEWENKINSLPGLQAPIKVENDVDDEGPPEQFTYITDYKAAEGIIIPDDPPVGCDCTNCYDMRKSCCASQSGNAFAYSRFGTLTVEPGTPIYECNKRCQCGPDCLNRVVQKGRQVKLSIYRTENGCGWGVKTLEKIKRGSFVMEYVGEVITNEEADKRGKIYDAIGRTYLFDLDYDDLETLYTVDAATYGNVAHFMNHSCDPNLVVYAVWINNLDPKLPRLAFFAKRDIKAFEELNFDYTMSTAGNATEALYRSPKTKSGLPRKISTNDKSHSIICKCGAESCKGYVF